MPSLDENSHDSAKFEEQNVGGVGPEGQDLGRDNHHHHHQQQYQSQQEGGWLNTRERNAKNEYPIRIDDEMLIGREPGHGQTPQNPVSEREQQALTLKKIIKDTARVDLPTDDNTARGAFAALRVPASRAKRSVSLKYAGVSVHYLVNFFLQLVEASGFSRASTIYEIENLKASPGLIRRFGLKMRCPRDGEMGASFAHALMALNPKHVGDATHMLSYTWGYSVGDIVDTLQEFCKKKKLDPKETYIWACFLCVNQHRVTERASAVPTREFLEEFGDRVEKIGRVVCMLSPWQRPLYLERVWCIYEFYTATLKLQQTLSFSDLIGLQNKTCEVSVVVPPRERESLAKALISENARTTFSEALDNVDVQHAKAFEENDRQAILRMIQDQDGGYSRTNDFVRKHLRGWVSDTVSQVQKNIDTIITLTDQRRLWKLLVITVTIVCSYIAILVPLIWALNERRSVTVRLPANTTRAPTQAPTLTKEGYVMFIISDFPDYTMRAIENHTSPQYKAFEFLQRDLEENNYYSDWPRWRIKQRFALATFYYATQGEHWKDNTGWLNYKLHECQWYTRPPQMHTFDLDNPNGTFLSTDSLSRYTDNPCEEEDIYNIQLGRYHHLSQWANDLVGMLPPEVFALLPELKSVNLDTQFGTVCTIVNGTEQCATQSRSSLSGSIPKEIRACTDLRVLSLGYHEFSGLLPSTIEEMSSLQFLRIYGNRLSGEIPPEIGLALSLRYLDLRYNSLSSTIPSEMGLLRYAQFVYLSGNALYGTIPNEIGQMIWLETFNVTGNPMLSGTIPSYLCNRSWFAFDCVPDKLCGCDCYCL